MTSTAQHQNIEHPSAHWQQLVNAAILGTDRNAAPLPESLPWSISNATDFTQQYLDHAGTLALYELAGRQASVNDSSAIAVKPCNVDDPLLSPRTSHHLLEILYGQQGDLLEQWLDAACLTQRYVRPELIGPMLRRAENKRDALQAKLLQIVGKRGQWLAQMHPTWHRLFAQPSQKDDANNWETAKLEQRLELLQIQLESDPATARQWVQSSWDQENVDTRLKMLETLADDLNSEDESWLESLLDDRSKQIKTWVSQRLSNLPTSALSQRMISRMQRCVEYKPAKGLLNRSGKLTITLLDEMDQAMQRDGLDAKAHQDMGAKAALLSQIVARTPLSWWEILESDISKWLKFAQDNEWALPLVTGWLQAIQTQHHAQWAQQFITDICLIKAPAKAIITDEWRQESLGQLLKILPADARATLTVQSLQNPKDKPVLRIDTLLKACDFQWDHAMSLHVINLLKPRVADTNVVYDNHIRHLIIHVISVHLATQSADAFTALFTQPHEHWSDHFLSMLQSAVQTVHFRKDMFAALNQTPSL
jgi:hypothetical protein